MLVQRQLPQGTPTHIRPAICRDDDAYLTSEESEAWGLVQHPPLGTFRATSPDTHTHTPSPVSYGCSLIGTFRFLGFTKGLFIHSTHTYRVPTVLF